MNFSQKTSSHQEKDVGTDHGTSADPMSHRIIEKRRRDRMNNCLADLSRLIPADYLKKGRGRVEKTEIIEMAIKHMKHLQALACRQIDQCELNQQKSPEEQNTNHSSSGGGGPIVIEHYRLGYQECLSETMHFLVEVEGFFAGDLICIELMNHLQKHCDKILKGNHINYPRAHLIETNSTSSGSTGSSSYHHTNSSALGSSAPGSSSSPGSGSCSDSGRNEIKEPVINGHLSTIHCLSKVIPPQMLANENSCHDDNHSNHSGPSQLREMLTGVNRSSNSLHIVNNKQNTLTPLTQTFQSPSPGLSNGMGNSSSVEHNGINGSSSAASLYKFKNNIKQRFSAEHHVDDRHHESRASNGIDPSCHYSGMKRRRYVTDVNDETPHDNNANNLLTFPMVQPSSRRRDSETCSVPSSPPSPEPKYIPPRTPSPEDTRMRGSPHRPIPNYGIPVFALHPKGTFYIPLTLDSDVLAPHFSDLGYAPELIHEVVHPVILHPVTISVNFQRVGQCTRTPRMMQPQLNHCASVSWNNEQNGFVPVQ